MTRIKQSRLCYLALLQLSALLCLSQSVEGSTVLNSQADENTAIRFFFQPPEGNYFHTPLLFRVVGEKDPRLNTAPVLFGGRTAFISLPEMRQLMQDLAHEDLRWTESGKVEVFGAVEDLRPTGNLEITVVSSKGTANGSLSPKKLCEVLAHLNSAITTPRALWELQRFRDDYGCKVSGFKPDEFPDHYYK